MKYGLLLALAILAAGCSNPFGKSNPYSPYGGTPPDTLRGQCERAAYNDPAVKDAWSAATVTMNNSPSDNMQRFEAVKGAAVQRCLAQRGGVGGGGGVELPR